MTQHADAVRHVTEHLTDRSAVLFLGAGINAEATDDQGRPCPLGEALARIIAESLLGDTSGNLSLGDAAEIARYRLGEKAVNDFLFEFFQRFRPSRGHLALVTIPWDVIYTTNFDLLVEAAARRSSSARICPIYTREKDLSQFAEDDVLYYKLHGSIDYANSGEGRLILTKDDYRHYEEYRRPLFRRLKTDLLRRTFLFLGYSLRDDNLRAILEDVRRELGTQGLPLSYWLRREASGAEIAFWKEKFNVSILVADAGDFLRDLEETWAAQGKRVLSFEERKHRDLHAVDSTASFPRVGSSFYELIPALCTGQSEPNLFYSGREITWADVREQIAPKRVAYWTLLEGVFADVSEPSSHLTAYLVTGHAGTGKTTLVRTIAYDLVHEFGVRVLVHIPGTPLDAASIAPLVEKDSPKRIVVIVHHAAQYVREIEKFIETARKANLPVSLILEERRNQWTFAIGAVGKHLVAAEIQVGAVNDPEIDAILAALAKHDCLGKLKGTDIAVQKEHFAKLANKELLVALRELTSQSSFDEIIRDEYLRIPSERARKAYLYVSALGQVGLWLRYENLINLLSLRYDQLGNEIFRPADGILISGEVAGSSRHNVGFRLSARHPVIASIIFGVATPSDEGKFQVINDVIGQLDPGYIEDRRLLEEIVRRRELVNTLSDNDRKRAVYDRLAQILPSYPYVYQHRSILERELHDASAAIEFARKAVAIERFNPSLQNTLGLALEVASREEKDVTRRHAYLAEADRIFEDGIKRDPGNPFAYIGKLQLLRQKVRAETDKQAKTLLLTEALGMLEDAFVATAESQVIASALGEINVQIGQEENALKIVTEALSKKETDQRLRLLQIDLLTKDRRKDEALAAAQKGVQLNPTSWRLYRALARTMRDSNQDAAAIRAHYESALRYKKGDLALMVELGAYLYACGKYRDAEPFFKEARESQATLPEKRRLREWLRDEEGKRKWCFGEVTRITGGGAHVTAIPENFQAFFWRAEPELVAFQVGDKVKFLVAFNAWGAQARFS